VSARANSAIQGLEKALTDGTTLSMPVPSEPCRPAVALRVFCHLLPTQRRPCRSDVDFAQLVKIYGRLPEPTERSYSPSRFVEEVSKPDKCVLEKIANLKATIALHFAHYNLCRPHSKFTSDACDGGRDFRHASGPSSN